MRTDNERDTDVIDLTASDAVDGDDITIVAPSGESQQHPQQHPRRRRTIAFLSVAVVAAAAVAAIAIAAIQHPSAAPRVSASATPTTEAKTTSNTGRPKSNVASSTPSSRAAVAATLPRASVPASGVAPHTTVPVNRSGAPVVPPSVASPPPTAHTPGTVMTAPPSVLQWSAAPASVNLAAGGRSFVTVTVRNPSGGVVTLPVPLSCAPKLDGSGVCPEVAQKIQPHTQQVVRYSVDAANVVPGSYELTIENGLFSIPVTVTA